MTEKWRDVAGYEGLYEVSDMGRVRSLDRVVKRCKCGEPLRTQKGIMLRGSVGNAGYPIVHLAKEGKITQKLVHRLVLETFVGPSPDGMEGCHQNGVRSDARLVNLRWDTRKANRNDQWAHGTMRVGEKTGSVKLTETKVKIIRSSQDRICDLARRFGVARSAIERIRKRETWKHIP